MTARASIKLAAGGNDFPVQSMRLDRGLAHPVGRAQIMLPAGATPPELGATATLTAVSNGADQALMTGLVDQIKTGPNGTHLTIFEPISALNIHAPDAAFSATTAGQIISGFCSDHGVSTATILPGITIPHMVLSSRMTLLNHCLRLAHLSGLALTSDTDGNVLTQSLALPIPTGTFDTTRAPTALQSMSSHTDAAKTRATGAGAFGTSGPGMTTLPLGDPSPIQSGPADAPTQTRTAALRILSDTLALQTASDFRSAAAHSGVSLTTPLPDAISPGDVVTIPDASGLPIRATRVESVFVTLSAHAGLTAHYAFSDVGGL